MTQYGEALDEARKTAADALHIVNMINALRREEGDSVEIFADNAGYNGANNAVECWGEWTGWAARRYTGDTLAGALEAAVKARNGEG